jgi:hypothetical protein
MLTALVCLALGGNAPSAPPVEASREDKGGWIILHLSGSPHDVGFQHGALAFKEIESTLRVFKFAAQSETSMNWNWYRTAAKRLFWSKLEPEYQSEISAIAEGAQSKGAKIDADDILALNAYIELSDYYLPVFRAKQTHSEVISRAPMACSAFVATGNATKDGKVVMGHNFWWGYLTGEHWNVVLDIHPEKGNHFMMDAAPGFIESGTDWAINDKGLGLCETTISGIRGFDENGLPEFQRMRKAIQYGDSLDSLSHILKAGNNGGYANTWLMVDAKSNEIGKLELGLKNVIFSSSTDGYYYGANFPEDPKLIREETPDYFDDGGSDTRKARWKKHLEADKGKVDIGLAESYIADSYDVDSKQADGGGGALCGKGGGSGAINGKALSADDILRMQFWARMGIPDGTNMVVANTRYSDAAKALMFDLNGQSWTLISAK